jgi:nucleotide-binding universal stress UspA family protein
MLKHLLVPLDGSRLAESALPVAAYLAKRLKADVILLHVIEKNAPTEVHRDRHITTPDEAQLYLEEISQRFFSPAIKVDVHVHSSEVSDVARSIIDHSAEEYEPDLIILCAHGNGGVRDLLFGSIAQQVASGSGIPVFLIRPPLASDQYQIKRMLVPLDIESIHDKAIPYAEILARVCSAQLDLLCVIPTMGNLYGEQAAAGNFLPATTNAYLEISEELAQEHFQAHLDDFQVAGLKATAVVSRGDPAAIILKTAEAYGSNLIVFGTHGHSGLDAFWNRSITASVARKTNTPMLLIPLYDE